MSEWISVDDDLPEDAELVLIHADEHGYCFGKTFIHPQLGYRVWNEVPGVSYIALVTHWMHLPEPPE